MWANHMLEGTSFRRPSPNSDSRVFLLDVRLNWSRSIPMSCVEEIALKIDNRPVPHESLALASAGEDLPLDAWRTRDDVWWPVLETATLSGSSTEPIADGSHELELELRVRVPGFPTGPDGVWPTRFNRVTVAKEIER